MVCIKLPRLDQQIRRLCYCCTHSMKTPKNTASHKTKSRDKSTSVVRNILVDCGRKPPTSALRNRTASAGNGVAGGAALLNAEASDRGRCIIIWEGIRWDGGLLESLHSRIPRQHLQLTAFRSASLNGGIPKDSVQLTPERQ